MLVYLRPSNEALLRSRVPGAQDQRGCPSNPFYRGGSASTETMPAVSPLPFQARSISLKGWGLIDLPLRASNEGLLRPRVARAQEIIRLHPLFIVSLIFFPFDSSHTTQGKAPAYRTFFLFYQWLMV
jgi:hypothetical protein